MSKGSARRASAPLLLLLAAAAVLAASTTLRCAAAATMASAPDYGDALSKSLLYFEAQRSGRLPYNQRVRWRGHSGITDGLQQGVDLVGGYYDAGDHVKFGLPMAFTVTMLAWGAIEFGDDIAAAGEWGHALEAIKWGTDYFVKAHTEHFVYWAEVGDGDTDHYCWQRPEDMTTSRQAYRVDKDSPGSDLVAETAAALAAASIVFRGSNPHYSHLLLHHAQQLFEFGDWYRGNYDVSIKEARSFYTSVSGYGDELLWAAFWLHRATGKDEYLQYAVDKAGSFGGVGWAMTEFGWDNKYAGLQVLAAKADLPSSSVAAAGAVEAGWSCRLRLRRGTAMAARWRLEADVPSSCRSWCLRLVADAAFQRCCSSWCFWCVVRSSSSSLAACCWWLKTAACSVVLLLLSMAKDSNQQQLEQGQADCLPTAAEVMKMRADAVVLLMGGAAQAMLGMVAVTATSGVATVLAQILSLPMAWTLLDVLAGVIDVAIGRCLGASYHHLLASGYRIISASFYLLLVYGLLVTLLALCGQCIGDASSPCGQAPDHVAIEVTEIKDAANTPRHGADSRQQDFSVRTVHISTAVADVTPSKPAPAPSGGAAGTFT